MKYSKLNEKAKKEARKSYQLGWLETHTEIFSESELDEFCKDCEDVIEYNKFGDIVAEYM